MICAPWARGLRQRIVRGEDIDVQNYDSRPVEFLASINVDVVDMKPRSRAASM